MAKLKLPRVPTGVPDIRRPGLAPAASTAAPALLVIGRRQFLKGVALLLAALATPLTGARRAVAAARGKFLTRPELRTLEALCDRIIPPDTFDGRSSPGGADLGAVRYIQRLLTAFDQRVPLIYAGGPFSGRAPLPDNRRGVASRRRPKNAFKKFIPLTRVQDIRWRAEVYGSASPQAPGAAFGDAERGPLVGLRDVYRGGLAAVDAKAQELAGDVFARLSIEDQDRVVTALDGGPESAFLDVLIGHTLEGCFAAPEYGGNRRLGGWKLVGLEGDNHPLGFSVFSTDIDGYRERADHPMSTPNPDELAGPRPLHPDSTAIQAQIATLSGVLGIDFS